MKSLSLLIIAAALSVSLLPSCSGTVSNGGQTVSNPSTSEMEKLEQQWGMAPRQTKPKLRELRPGETVPTTAPASSGGTSTAPQPLAPAPPLQQGTSAAASPALIEPSVDAATLQKLR